MPAEVAGILCVLCGISAFSAVKIFEKLQTAEIAEESPQRSRRQTYLRGCRPRERRPGFPEDL